MKIAIIPARGGSKRIPGKNIREFLGIPIIAYSIKAAINSGIFDEVMVSTDSDEIVGIAKKYGAAVPFMRSEKTSDDYATTSDVLHEVISEYKKHGKSFEWLCCSYPTAPFISAEKLRSAYKTLKKSAADALIPVVPFSFPPLRGMIIENELVKMKWPENQSIRAQDLGTMYHDSGQFYFVRTSAFLRENTLFCKKTIPMILSELEVQDIDNETDWKLAELKYKLMIEQG